MAATLLFVSLAAAAYMTPRCALRAGLDSNVMMLALHGCHVDALCFKSFSCLSKMLSLQQFMLSLQHREIVKNRVRAIGCCQV